MESRAQHEGMRKGLDIGGGHGKVGWQKKQQDRFARSMEIPSRAARRLAYWVKLGRVRRQGQQNRRDGWYLRRSR
jgi:hypothetical protein